MSERNEIKRDGARPQKNSGRGRDKGDAILGPFCYDVKEFSMVFSISQNVWGKVCTDALRARKEPALKIVLGRGNDKTRLWVISEDMMNEMLDAWRDKYNGGS